TSRLPHQSLTSRSRVQTYESRKISSQRSKSLERGRIAAAASATRLPTVYGYREHVETGGLVSYGVNLDSCFHRAATYVYKILKGTSAADLPVEFPTKLELVINLKTAKALGIEVPPTLIARADEVIE